VRIIINMTKDKIKTWLTNFYKTNCWAIDEGFQSGIFKVGIFNGVFMDSESEEPHYYTLEEFIKNFKYLTDVEFEEKNMGNYNSLEDFLDDWDITKEQYENVNKKNFSILANFCERLDKINFATDRSKTIEDISQNIVYKIDNGGWQGYVILKYIDGAKYYLSKLAKNIKDSTWNADHTYAKHYKSKERALEVLKKFEEK